MAKRLLHDGRVVRTDGTPVADALVAVASGTAPTPEIAIRTNAEGRFRIALPDGRFVLEAHGPDGSAGGVELTVEGEERTISIPLKAGGEA